MRYCAILTLLLLIAVSSINSTHSSLQQVFVIQSMGSILVQDNFADAILFEYGAESGVLQPPWDIAGGSGSGSQGDSYVAVDNTHVRTGSQAVKFYQQPPPKDDKARRIVLRKWNSGHKEFYLSWWLYFDDTWLEDTTPDGAVLGAIHNWFGPLGDRWAYLTSANMRVWKSRKVGTGLRLPFGSSSWTSSDYFAPLNQWFHLQIYVKWAKDNTGVVRFWYNDILVREETGIKTDPEGYSQWQSDFDYKSGAPYPAFSIILYNSKGTPERWYWADDIVAATEKVPETYGL